MGSAVERKASAVRFRPDEAGTAALRLYRQLPAQARFHTYARWVSAPFPLVAELLPRTGRVLDFGCGHGLFSAYCAIRSPELEVVGVDIDVAKVSIGNLAIEGSELSERVDLRNVDVGWQPDPGEFDAVVTNDVLYLLGKDRAATQILALAQACRPGGTLVIKEIGESPAWKASVNQLQEYVATKVLKYTKGSELEVLSEGFLVDHMTAAGLLVRRIAMDRGYPHAHVAFVGRGSGL